MIILNEEQCKNITIEIPAFTEDEIPNYCQDTSAITRVKKKSNTFCLIHYEDHMRQLHKVHAFFWTSTVHTCTIQFLEQVHGIAWTRSDKLTLPKSRIFKVNPFIPHFDPDERGNYCLTGNLFFNPIRVDNLD